ncbi:MAG: hypothetical protein V3T08_09675 [Gemmatimonadota bacterium]
MAKPEVFAQRIRNLAEGVLVNAAKLVRDTVNAAGSNVVKATPVDTGLARSNWVAAEGSPNLSARGIRSESSTIDEIASVAARVKADAEVHIANGGSKVNYLERLNAGSSFQAPANFVRIALMLAREALKKDTRLLNPRS